MNKLIQDTSIFFDSLIEKNEGSKEKVVTFDIRATKALVSPEVAFDTVFHLSPQYKELGPIFEFINRQLTHYIRFCSVENSFASTIARRLNEENMISINEEFCSLSFTFEDQGDMIDVEFTLHKEYKSLERYLLQLSTFFSNYLTEGLNNYVLFKDEELSVETYEIVYDFERRKNHYDQFETKEGHLYGPSNLYEAIKESHGMNWVDIHRYFHLLSYVILDDTKHDTGFVMEVKTNFLLFERIVANEYAI
ncbi:hypothetical protein [Bacillus sp. AFS055030]|uniref:hypothetical protein n=1 Tax=Bacillus sp. AFS055030 TaxID=2033507 RepID=UPI000BFB35BB|nr:hypothetical protein [Bacillus sp. AFS055030]